MTANNMFSMLSYYKFTLEFYYLYSAVLQIRSQQKSTLILTKETKNLRLILFFKVLIYFTLMTPGMRKDM